jgi:hypothetical protein
MPWFEQGWKGGDGWNLSGEAVDQAQICYGSNLRKGGDGWNPQDNMCHHVSGVERLAYYIGML